MDWRRWAALGCFLVVVIGVGSLIGFATAPDGWYATLAKPPFNPPNWVFAPVWLALYVLIAVAGFRTFMRDPSSPPMFLWILQMILNWAWSPTWFTLHLMWPAFAIIIAILALIVGFIVTSWRRDRLAARLFVPYGLWIAFASSLNVSIALLN
jgi:translocator protein